jgi:hypothetical protein
VHESSHFTANGGTDDIAYGQARSKNLASNNPDYAVKNADSHVWLSCAFPPNYLPIIDQEYFVENTPFSIETDSRLSQNEEVAFLSFFFFLRQTLKSVI